MCGENQKFKASKNILGSYRPLRSSPVPPTILWRLFSDTWFTYEFNGIICAVVVANPENKSYTDIVLTSLYYGNALVQLMGLTALLGSIIVLLNYCTLPTLNSLQHIKKLTRNIILFFFAVLVYVVVEDLGLIRIQSQVLVVIISYLPYLVKITSFI